MTVSQSLYLDDATAQMYDDTIKVTNVPIGQFIFVSDIKPPANGSTTREISVSLMKLEQAPGGTRSTNSNVYVRQSGETAVKVTVFDIDGKEVASNTTNYS